jgi:hypothetical protein
MRKFSPILCALFALTICPSFSFAQADEAARSSIIVNVSPDTATAASSEVVQFTALVKNTPHAAVTWTASAGKISGTGLYHAPRVSSDTAVRITATSVADPSKSAAATIIVRAHQAAPAEAKADASTPVVNAAGSTPIKESFFGAGFNGGGNWPPTDGQKQVATLGSIRLWDDGVKWAQIETGNGVYNWAKLDSWISKAQAQHLDVLYTIGNTPQWAGKIPAKSPCGPSGPYSCSAPTDLSSDGTGSDAKFSAFITALVKRYKGQIAYYELWNEPDCTCFWAGTTAQIVRMGKDAASIIRSTDPAAKIISPSAHGPTMKTWFDDYVAAGGAANFDIVNAHLRGSANPPNSSPEAFLTMWDDVTTETAKRGLSKLPVWDDEYGIKKDQLTDPDMLAGFTARALILRAGVGVQRQFVYTWDANPPYGLQGSDSGTAWDVVAGWLLNHSISPCVAKGTVYTCSVDSGQIVWDTAQSCNHGSCSTSNYTRPSNYSKQTNIEGVKTSATGSTVKIGYKPIFLTAN